MGHEIAGVYEDDGLTAKSGHLEERLGLTRLLVDAEAGRFDLVLVVDVDRLTRADDMIERAAILGPLQRRGILVATPAGVMDMNTFMGDVAVGLGAAMAAQFRRNLLERTARGRQQAILRGSKPSGPTPYGLTWSRSSGWGIHEAEAAIVREIHDRAIRGEPCHAIAADLNARGIRPRRASTWSAFTVWHLCRVGAERYAGTWGPHRIAVPRVLTDEQIEQAAEALAGNRARGLEQRTGTIYLLDRRRMTCARCGNPIGVDTAKHQHRARYVCTARKRRECDLPTRRVDVVDGTVWAELVDLIVSDDLVEIALRANAGRDRPAPTAIRWLARAHEDLERVERLERRVIEHALAGGLSEEEMAARLASFAPRRQAAQDAIREATQAAGLPRDGLPSVTPEAVRGAVDELRTRVASAGPEERRRLTRLVVSGAVLGPSNVDLRLSLPVPAAAWRGQNRTVLAVYAPAG